MSEQTRKFWGWGVHEADPSPAEIKAFAERLQQRHGLKDLKFEPPPRIEEIHLRPPRVKPPAKLAPLCSQSPLDRAGHTYGKSFKDVVRAYQRDFAPAPDWVALPRTESEVMQVLDWCGGERIAVIPYGGGSSVVQGVEPAVGDAYRGTVSLDLKHLTGLLELDKTSRAANIQAGTLGPALEEQLRPHRLTLRHFPQSFEFSTLGGWIATRSGGHYATLYTHIDDFVENLRVVTPKGILETRRLPGDGAGPAPERMLIGSEGILGVITSAWMRLQDRPTYRASASVFFPEFMAAARAVRAISQAGLYPANVRILDPAEALINDVSDGKSAVMVLGFESADHPVDAWFVRALECCRDHGGTVPRESAEKQPAPREPAAKQSGGERAGHGHQEGAAGAWRGAFIRMPYWRDVMVGLGMLSETFETAITWDRFPDFHQQVMAATQDAVTRVCGQGTVSVRFTHAYPDGPAPYYSIRAPGKPGSQLQMMQEIKAAASDAVIKHGGTITHHHAVGRYHRPWYDKQSPPLFAQALRAAKKTLDPAGIMNPGVLIDP